MTQPSKKITRRRPGPKPRGPFEDKQATLTTRITAQTRQRLEEAAEASGLSLSQEIERRLDRSFKEDHVDDEIIKERWGDKFAYNFMKVLASVKMLVENQTGKSMKDDWDTFFAVRQAWQRIIEAVSAPQIPDGWMEKHTPPPESNRLRVLSGEHPETYEPLPKIGQVAADVLLEELVKALREKKQEG